MIYSLRGKIVYCDAQSLAVECGGVAYHCQATLATLSKVAAVGSEALVYTHMNIRQDAVDLFAFADQTERNMFRLLTSVTGVGPKVALSVLSALSPERFALAVAAEDIPVLTQAPGVGKKLAQRMVLELRDKIGAAQIEGGLDQGAVANLSLDTGSAAEAIAALVVLGYGQSDAAAVISKLDAAMPVDEMIKAGLKALAGGR